MRDSITLERNGGVGCLLRFLPAASPDGEWRLASGDEASPTWKALPGTCRFGNKR
jgi:hypothetical protein